MKSRSFLVGVLLLAGFFCLPAANAAYQDTKVGTLTIRIVIPEEVPAASVLMSPDSPSVATEVVVPQQSTSPSVIVTTTSLPQQPAEPSTPEEPTPTSASTEEKEAPSVPVAP